MSNGKTNDDNINMHMHICKHEHIMSNTTYNRKCVNVNHCNNENKIDNLDRNKTTNMCNVSNDNCNDCTRKT